MYPKKVTAMAAPGLAPALLVILLMAGCTESGGSLKSGDDNMVVAVINGEKILAGKFIKEFNLIKRKFRVQDRKDFKLEELLWLRTKTLNKLIQTLLFVQQAEKNKVQVTEGEFQRELQRMKSRYEEDSFKQVFEIENISREDWESKLKNDLLIKNLINKEVNSKVTVREEELAEYFEKHPEEFHKPEQVKALHIIVASEEEARKILKKLKTRRAKFAALAKKYSLGPEGADGGNLGYFEAGQMPEEFDEIFKLKIKKTSEIIRTPYGFHIFKVVDKKPERKMSFEESKSLIQAKLLRQLQETAFRKWLEKIKQRADIKISYENLAKIK